MDFSKDELRRELRDAHRAQDAAVRATPRLVEAVASGEAGLSPAQKLDTFIGGLARRRFLTAGGLSVAAAAVLAACGKPHKALVPQVGLTPSTSGLPDQVIDDIVLLRTASSLEHSAVNAYQKVLDGNMLPADLVDAAKLFQDHHREHASIFEKATKDAGGQAFTDPNPVIDKNIVAVALDAISKSADKNDDAVRFAHALESIAAGTYQSVVPTLTKPALRAAAMSVGGVEARHAAVIAKFVKSDGGGIVAGLTTAAATTTTAAAKSAATTAEKLTIVAVFQVPGSFGSLAAVPVTLNATNLSIDIPGPNSYMYK